MIRTALARRLPDAISLPARTRWVAAAVFIATAALPASAFASMPDEDGPVRHYEVAVPFKLEAARSLLGSAMLVVENAHKAGLHGDVHEASYSLEAAAERLSQVPDADAVLIERLKSTIEIVHLASEIEDEAILREAVPRLKLVVDEALAAFGD